MTASDVQNSPTVWLVMLERARRTGDEESERKAMAELRRLGVLVKWPADPQELEAAAS